MGKKHDTAETADFMKDFEKGLQLSRHLQENMRMMDRLFQDVDVLLHRRFQNPMDDDLDFCIYFTDGVVDSSFINDFILKPILLANHLDPSPELLEQVKNTFVAANDVKMTNEITTIIESVTYGDTILFAKGCNAALIISSKSFTLRGVSEPESEKVLSGPREGFTEGILVNLSMIRRRLRTNHLKMKYQSVGRVSTTSVCLCYIDTIANPKIVDEITRRLSGIELDAVLDSNYLKEYIAEPSFLLFPTCGHTERPDVVTAKLLEGRVAIFVDGTPMVLTAPYLFAENFQSNEDYYVNSGYASMARVLRFIGFFLAILVPAVYVAIVGFHHEILPTSLMINITAERQNVPLPAAVEAFVMLIVFDILREAGVRMPAQVGQALSIVGALVVGQAAVEAHLIASPMIIVVALTGITGLIIPRLTSATILCRNVFLILSSTFGLFGLLLVFSALITHLFNLETFGVPYVMLPSKLSLQAVKDTFIRAPWPYMIKRYLPFSRNLTRSAGRSGSRN